MGKFSRNGLLLGIVLLAIACSGGSSPDLVGAAGTVQTFYEHLDSGRYDEAIALYDAATKEQLLPDASSMDGFRQWAEAETHNGGLSDVSVVTQTAGEGTVTIEFELTFDDGQTARRTVTLTESDGAWRMGTVAG
jgi:hypothetical protein